MHCCVCFRLHAVYWFMPLGKIEYCHLPDVDDQCSGGIRLLCYMCWINMIWYFKVLCFPSKANVLCAADGHLLFQVYCNVGTEWKLINKSEDPQISWSKMDCKSCRHNTVSNTRWQISISTSQKLECVVLSC
jgi:hypothetical protein